MGRWGQGRAIAALLLALVAGFGYTGTARADVEPNNVISFAEGPIDGALYNGSIATPDDVDIYVFYAHSQQQIHLDWDLLTPDRASYCLDVDLLDTHGRALTSDYTTPPGVNRFFIRVQPDSSSCAPMQYRFQITPAAAFATGPALDRNLSPTGEPNETPGQAIGPLGANINYVGAEETANDEDWFFFWVPAGTHQLEISTTSPAWAEDCSSEIALYTDSTSYSASSASADWTSFSRISQTVTGPAKYYLKASTRYCGLGARWQFRIETPSAISLVDPTPPPPPPAPKPPARVVQSKYPSSISLRRSGARYSGRVNSSLRNCKANRRVVLRRVGSGSKSFGSARTRANGTFTIRRGSRLRGRIYVVVTGRSSAETLCRSANSRRIRG